MKILHDIVTYCHMIFLSFFRNNDVTMRQLSAVSCHPSRNSGTGLPDPCLDRPCSLIPSWPSLPHIATIPASEKSEIERLGPGTPGTSE